MAKPKSKHPTIPPTVTIELPRVIARDVAGVLDSVANDILEDANSITEAGGHAISENTLASLAESLDITSRRLFLALSGE